MPNLYPVCRALLLTLLLGGCAVPATRPVTAAVTDPVIDAAAAAAAALPVEVVDAAGNALTLAALAETLAGRRVVYIGEQHDRYDHHLLQFELIRRLQRLRPGWAIGLEQVQRPFQPVLDDYVAGRVDERGMLERSEYFERWGFDYRLYRPILRFARAHGLPLVALNVDGELRRAFADNGRDGLSPEQRRGLPEFDFSDGGYRERLRNVYRYHATADDAFERFYQTQLLWDETMADSAARYLRDNPDRSLIVLAGSGHLAHRSGIPNRLQRRLAVDDVLLMPADSAAPPANGADYLLVSSPVALPSAGRMGIMLAGDDGGVSARQVVPDSAAAAAGVRDADRIVAIDGLAVESLSQVRLALLDKRPGDRVTLTLRRAVASGGADELALELTLGE